MSGKLKLSAECEVSLSLHALTNSDGCVALSSQTRRSPSLPSHVLCPCLSDSLVPTRTFRFVVLPSEKDPAEHFLCYRGHTFCAKAATLQRLLQLCVDCDEPVSATLSAEQSMGGKSIGIFVRDQDGSRLDFRLPSGTTVDFLRRLIEAKLGYGDHGNYFLLWDGSRLHDANRLSDFDLEDGDCIDMICKQVGGMFHETSGRVDNQLLKLKELHPTIKVQIRLPQEDAEPRIIELDVDPLSPGAALSTLLQRALDAEVSALEADVERTQLELEEKALRLGRARAASGARKRPLPEAGASLL